MTKKPSFAASTQRLSDLRIQMKEVNVAAYLVPRQDEFQGEYVAPYADRLKWLTGFTGSWGMAIVALKKAAIFVDGRYTVQVRSQVDVNAFQPQHLMNEPPANWLSRNLKPGDRVGFDPWLLTVNEAARYRSACEAARLVLVPIAENLIDRIWNDQPPRPSAPIEIHPLQHAGRKAEAKLKDIAAGLKASGVAAMALSDTASIAWALNIRSNDIRYTPVALAHAIVSASGKAELFANPERVTPKTAIKLRQYCKLRAPDEFSAALAAHGNTGTAFAIDPATAPEAVRHLLEGAGAKIKEMPDPCVLPRARKNQTEQEGARIAHKRDGVAVTNFLCWLESAAAKGNLTERQAADKLLAFRQDTKQLRDLSFETIPAAGPNAALPHYHLSHGKGRSLVPGKIFLIDSGGQYAEGTTDITRTVMIGKPSAEIKDRFTRVLKGMIAISVLRFPQGTTGAHIDALARASLWKAGFDFDHGTGHGVGSYLSVHEGPARISKAGHSPLMPGMILSNEPGYYKTGHYGIRIENLLLVQEPAKIKDGDRPMLGFETLTLAPIDRTLINQHLLTREEVDWIDAYHARVKRELSPKVLPETRKWLVKSCAPLT